MECQKERFKNKFQLNNNDYFFYDITKVEGLEKKRVSQLPYTIKILMESLLRQFDGNNITIEHIEGLLNWKNRKNNGGKKVDIPFKPSRVILQDSTGLPVLVDLVSLRNEIASRGGNPDEVNPEIPVDLVIDHSIQVDKAGTKDALIYNTEMEFKRNKERYTFFKWSQNAFDNFQVIPPGNGIIHQINLEYLSKVISSNYEEDNGITLFPEMIVGTDSHTTMINSIGILGWGVGGIEAEAGILGKPIYINIPEIIGVRLNGNLPPGTTSTDCALKITQILREKGVVGKFVEFFGPGMSELSIYHRATIANMAPEYGATCGFFPIDGKTLEFLLLTGKTKEHVNLVETYCKKNSMFYDKKSQEPEFGEILEIDLTTIESCLAGPKRPQDVIPLSKMQKSFQKAIITPVGPKGYGLPQSSIDKSVSFKLSDQELKLKTGAIVVAAITSCTNTSNPYVMLGAGLLAKKAVENDLVIPSYVKTSLAPGSKVVTKYLEDSGLLNYMEKIGFNIVAYGCTTCVNAGPLKKEIEKAIIENDLLVSSVLSGNRNFEGRIHPLIQANYLASPLLVIAYALAGTININLDTEPLGYNKYGEKIYLKDIWPETKEVEALVNNFVKKDSFISEYRNISNEKWSEINTKNSLLYHWDENSTYIQEPLFLKNITDSVKKINNLCALRVLGIFGDSVTTDHISPASKILEDTPAGIYLKNKGIEQNNFNTYASRRGNHEIMVRGTFANNRILNRIAEGKEGGFTKYWPTNEIMPIYDAALKYNADEIGLVVLAGKDYGMGSSRDWAAKGTALLGVKVVIAESFERIHRDNLIALGVLPLQFLDNENARTLGLTGEEIFDIEINDHVEKQSLITVIATKENQKKLRFQVKVRFDKENDIEYYRNGGILPMILRQKIKKYTLS